MNLQAPELLIILVVILLLFGGAKLPKLARSLGEAQREFKHGIGEGKTAAATQGEAAPETGTPTPGPTPAPGSAAPGPGPTPAPGADAPATDESGTGPIDPA